MNQPEIIKAIMQALIAYEAAVEYESKVFARMENGNVGFTICLN